jgi:uncharacterized protein YndB with AHSA1/START domain
MNNGLTINRVFAAPRERVFAAWTTPELFSVWFGTDVVDVPLETLTMDVRVGGSWSAVMHLPDGNTIDWVGEYLEVAPPSRLVLTITDNPADAARGTITVELSQPAGATGPAMTEMTMTEMTMTQTGTGLTDAQLAQTKIGYNGFFDVMEELLEANG